MLYAYPYLGGRDLGFFRLLGPGLGNLLFPWARAVVASAAHGLQLIAPTWSQLKLGPILRNEPDKRFYGRLFRTPPAQVSGWRRLYLLARLPRVTEKQFRSGDCESSGESIVVFSGMEGLFAPILRDHAGVLEALEQVTREEHKAGLKHDFAGSVTMHVRGGDFAQAPSGTTLSTNLGSWRLPIDWYVSMVSQLRAHFGSALKVYVFSDSSEDELGPLLSLPGSSRITFGSAIADMLAMSRSRLLVSAGNSTFSLWAAYLGRMPSIYYRGQLRQRLYYDDPGMETECGQENPPSDSFLQRVRI